MTKLFIFEHQILATAKLLAIAMKELRHFNYVNGALKRAPLRRRLDKYSGDSFHNAFNNCSLRRKL